MKTTFEIVMMFMPQKTQFTVLLFVRMMLLQPLSAEETEHGRHFHLEKLREHLLESEC